MAQTPEVPNYAELLGWSPAARVVIFHVDDVGMSHSSNRGAIEALEGGAATSMSLMMPCPWIPEIAHYLREHPQVDAGLHLTLTSEWKPYRWGPLAGRAAVPGLVDPEGCLWPSVADVVGNASAEEVDREMRAQVERAETLGIPITHLDSHMGTLFASPEFLERYVRLGIEKGIPVLMAGGHLRYVQEQNPDVSFRIREVARRVWDAGLPVLDDLHTASYGWPPGEKLERFIELLRGLEPGVTEIIVHASRPTGVFPHITDSSDSRLADLEALLSPELAAVVRQERIILTTWRELLERRRALTEGVR